MQFSKMHGLGNDFVVVDAVTQNAYFTPETIKRLADRHRGIGFDQLLIVEPPYDPDLDFHYRIFNADGSEVSQCGNGARCFARFVTLKGLTNKKDIKIIKDEEKEYALKGWFPVDVKDADAKFNELLSGTENSFTIETTLKIGESSSFGYLAGNGDRSVGFRTEAVGGGYRLYFYICCRRI